MSWSSGNEIQIVVDDLFFPWCQLVVLFVRLTSGVTVPVLFAALCGQHVAGTGVRVGLAASFFFRSTPCPSKTCDEIGAPHIAIS